MRTHTFVLDPDTTDIVKNIPKQKKSEFIRDAILLKAHQLAGPEVSKIAKTVRIKI